jgi:hypothetical protein
MIDINEKDINVSEFYKDEYALNSSIIGPYPDYNVGIGSSTGINGTYSVGTIGASGSVLTTNSTGPMWTTSPYTIGTTSLSNWNNISTKSPSIKVSGDAEFEGRVKINGQDLAQFMETMSKRLAILVPDPAKLEHFEALKKAYDHYKLMEALCELPEETKE